MDAVKFIEERNRMCESFNYGCGCQMCPACDNDLHCAVSQESTLDATAQITIVEKWSVAHPRKTRRDVFLEQYPDAFLDKYGALLICPRDISADYRDSNGDCGDPDQMCIDCRRKFWMQEVE